MKYIVLLFTVLFSSPAFAVKLADCDHEEYDMIVRNSGQSHVAHLTRLGGEIEEFGPEVSFQLKSKHSEEQNAQRIIKATDPTEEFCIWSGAIRIQRLSMQGASPGTFSLR